VPSFAESDERLDQGIAVVAPFYWVHVFLLVVFIVALLVIGLGSVVLGY